MIGAGGVASYLLPCLLKAFPKAKVVVMDDDTLEERNLDRQLFPPTAIGKKKATALCELYPERTEPLNQWLVSPSDVPPDTTVIICVADNHKARRTAIEAAYNLQIRCFLGGNEYFDAEAYVTWVDHNGTVADPRVRYPAIATSDEGSPLGCQGLAQIATPQLAIANYRCAGMLLHLLYLWETYYEALGFSDRRSAREHLPIELQSTLTTTTAITEFA